ncbi:PTS fructose transporter subunit IIA [Solimonas sp. K1W22B-7]|uniref:PTS sugar transporter subunit IIA n=1 Tax=Solimonas sp. K1W22B-7 TaxID=2303331 RepID=UPI000E32DAEA|nr:PTS fructose transporter subunit IIA [Solimonas sp. K1W22B-7]AXQ28035.1 PTS fructose transporter subunit IIA [Solimonas sp. K1W22B-7]
MSVGVLLVTHGKLGQNLLETMHHMLGDLPLRNDALEVHLVQNHDGLILQGQKLADLLDDGDGVLILTDAFGSTPSNIANKLAAGREVRVVSGINLPMLIRIFNYPRLSLSEMAQGAVDGGQRGIIACPHKDKGA